MNRTKKIIAALLLVVLISTPALEAKAAFTKDDLGSLIGTAAGCVVGNLIAAGLNAIGSAVAKEVGKSIGKALGGSSYLGFSFKGFTDSLIPQLVSDTKTEATTATTAKKVSCLNAIERQAAQLAIKKLSEYTINWINHGFQGGGPLFVTNEGSFLDGIQKQGIQTFINKIAFDTKNYPFGQDIARTIISGSNKDTSTYTLDDVIAKATGVPNYKAADFQKNFSVGGWNAFEAQLDPRNNPIGFANLIESSLHDTIVNNPDVKQAQNEIQRNTGFLDTKVCVNPAKYSADSLKEAQQVLSETPAGDDEQSQTMHKVAQDAVDALTCKRWETQTPGSVIVNQLNTTLGSPFRQLEVGQDLSSSLNSIFSALIQQLTKKGLSLLSSNNTTTQYKNNGGQSMNTSVTISNDNGTSDGGNWANANQNFNILTDIPAVIATQTQYRDILQQQDDLVEKQVIPDIYELDYCIPGPNPLWTNGLLDKVDQLASSDDGLQEYDYLSTFLGSPQDDYSQGTHAPGKDREKVDGVHFTTAVLQDYMNDINSIYDKKYMPTMTIPAYQEYPKIAVYQDGLDENKDIIDNINLRNKRLENLQDQITKLPKGVETKEYADKLKVIQDGFTRIATNLFTDEDIPIAQDTVSQIQDEIDFLASPVTGLIDECLGEVTSPTYTGPNGRTPYAGPVAINTHGLPTTKTFLQLYGQLGTDDPRDYHFGPNEGDVKNNDHTFDSGQLAKINKGKPIFPEQSDPIVMNVGGRVSSFNAYHGLRVLEYTFNIH